jgi:uncharacterized protein YdeI (YjbR/CyaY-like superfamily)
VIRVESSVEFFHLPLMSRKDQRIDAYIARSADFARPILSHVRKLAHAACPEVEETLKWGMPHFLHKGILLGMAAFKQHCALHFWKGSLIFGSKGFNGEAMGQFGRITSMADLPGDQALLGYIRKAVEFNEAGIKKTSGGKSKNKKVIVVPDYFQGALAENAKARATFENFSYSHRKEYVEWITEARRAETRARRIQTALKLLAAGKPHNWKYQSRPL